MGIPLLLTIIRLMQSFFEEHILILHYTNYDFSIIYRLEVYTDLQSDINNLNKNTINLINRN